ncbi:unnamed protein product, partial [Mesorhabditis spiculigera]
MTTFLKCVLLFAIFEFINSFTIIGNSWMCENEELRKIVLEAIDTATNPKDDSLNLEIVRTSIEKKLKSRADGEWFISVSRFTRLLRDSTLPTADMPDFCALDANFVDITLFRIE